MLATANAGALTSSRSTRLYWSQQTPTLQQSNQLLDQHQHQHRHYQVRRLKASEALIAWYWDQFPVLGWQLSVGRTVLWQYQHKQLQHYNIKINFLFSNLLYWQLSTKSIMWDNIILEKKNQTVIHLYNRTAGTEGQKANHIICSWKDEIQGICNIGIPMLRKDNISCSHIKRKQHEGKTLLLKLAKYINVFSWSNSLEYTSLYH